MLVFFYFFSMHLSQSSSYFIFKCKIKKLIVQALRGTVPGHQCGRRKSLERANRVQEALQIQKVRGDWREAADLLPIRPLYHLFLGGVQRNHRVDRGACVSLDIPGGRVWWNSEFVSGLFLHDALGRPQKCDVSFLVKMPQVKVSVLSGLQEVLVLINVGCFIKIQCFMIALIPYARSYTYSPIFGCVIYLSQRCRHIVRF